MSLLSTIQDFCLQQGFDKTYWVGYSGGVDSQVLLHLLVELRATYPIRLRAVHINHGLSMRAAEWADRCAATCKTLSVDYLQQSIDVTASSGESPEEVAREGRYAALSALLAPGDILLTAHHQDDQAETALLQLFRGAGPKGLAAMPPIKPFGQGIQARPLLNHLRAELMAYATQRELTWIEDESNQNIDFSRNFIRHHVLPILKKRWPSIATTVARVSSNCAEAQQLLDEMTTQDLAIAKGSLANTLSVSRFLTLSAMRQRQVLRLWLNILGFPIPGMVKIQQVQRDLFLARSDKSPHMTWKGVELRRYRDEVYALRCVDSHDVKQVIAWDLQQALVIPKLGVLQATPVLGQGIKASLTDITVRFRQGGEVCRLPGRNFSHTLKNLFQERHVLPWERDRIPLLYVKDKLAAAVGLFIDHDFIAREDQAGFLLSLKTLL